MPAAEKIEALKAPLERIDAWVDGFSKEIKRVSDRHTQKGGNLEYAYVQHFHTELRSLSSLFQYLMKDSDNKKYVFFPTRAAIETMLYLEYVLREAKKGADEVLTLLSRDMAQSADAMNAAAPSSEDNLMNATIKDVAIVNKILKTDFDLEKTKPRSHVFPRISNLCGDSKLSLKDARGNRIYHIYALYSESNHLRLGSQAAISKDFGDIDTDVCWALEYFIEAYMKFYEQILESETFPSEYIDSFNAIKQPLGIK